MESSEAMTEILNNLELLRQMILCIGGEKIAVAKEVSAATWTAAGGGGGVLHTLWSRSCGNTCDWCLQQTL